MPIRYLETGSTDPCLNLAIEQYVLENKRQGDWLLLWQNANTVVVGLNQNTLEEIDLSFAQLHGVRVVRRMTGGGAVYHDLGNLNYSFITDLGNAAELSIGRFTEPVCRALAGMGVRAETQGRNDITVEGRKVSGVAQRIYKDRILHHGTLLFSSDPEMIAGALRADPLKFSSKSAKSVRSRVGNLKDSLPEGATLETFWTALLGELAGDGLLREELSSEELEAARVIARERYGSWDWTYGKSPDYDFKNRIRCAGGSLEVRLSVSDGCIRDIAFLGDYMAAVSNGPLRAALMGTRLERDSVASVLEGMELGPMLGAVTAADVLSCIFD